MNNSSSVRTDKSRVRSCQDVTAREPRPCLVRACTYSEPHPLPSFLSKIISIMAEGSYHYQFRLILIGNSGVGKSCILGRLKNPDYFNSDIVPTLGTDFYTKTIEVDGKTIKIQLWDSAGQEKYKAVARGYYRNVVGGFLVFDVKDRASFDSLSQWLEDAKEGAQPREPTFVLVGNKIDKEEKKPRLVSYQEAEGYARRLGMDYIETSAKTGQNMDELLPFLANRVYWKLRVKTIKPEQGWLGVSEGDLTTSQRSGTINFSTKQQYNNSRRCC